MVALKWVLILPLARLKKYFPDEALIKECEEIAKQSGAILRFEEDPVKIWDSNIFGKSLHELINEGLHNKLHRMPGDARMKMQETVERVINEGCSGLICIIL